MTDVAKAIKELDSTAGFVVDGEPTNETEYKSNVKFISGADENGVAVFKDTQDFTWSQVSAKKAELQTAYDAKDYARKRERSYPNLKEFAEAYCEKEINGDSTKWDAYKTAYNKVRSDNPKE
jgi:hypothetical protein